MKEDKENFDPFDAETEKKPKRERKTSVGRRIAYSAVGTALSVVMIVLACYLPLTVLPLVLISLCLNIVYRRCGIAFGLVSTVAVAGLGFLFCIGHIGVMLTVCIVFLPYSLICYFLRNTDYSGVKKGFIRGGVMTAFISVAFMGLYFLADMVAEFLDIGGFLERFDSIVLPYLIVNAVLAVAIVIVDFVYLEACRIILPKLK